MFDLEALSKAVPGDDPVGKNTEYDELMTLERLAAGTPGTPDPKTHEIVGAEPPEWRKVGQAAADLLAQSKDLRAGCILARAELATDGFAGLARGLMLLSRILRDFWDGVYPQLDKEDGNNPTERVNAMTYLDDLSGFIAGLRSTPLVESREAGRYTLRDLDLAAGRIPVSEGTHVPSLDLLSVAWSTGDPAANALRRDAVDQSLTSIADIEAIFTERAKRRPGFERLKQNLVKAKQFFESQKPAIAAGTDGASGPDDDPNQPKGPTGVVPQTGGLASRADAIKSLKQVADYLRRVEPSSPAPLFIDRAVKLLQMDFAAIVLELVPDARERITLLSGVTLDEPAK